MRRCLFLVDVVLVAVSFNFSRVHTTSGPKRIDHVVASRSPFEFRLLHQAEAWCSAMDGDRGESCEGGWRAVFVVSADAGWGPVPVTDAPGTTEGV